MLQKCYEGCGKLSTGLWEVFHNRCGKLSTGMWKVIHSFHALPRESEQQLGRRSLTSTTPAPARISLIPYIRA